jgi:hypothetical protein
MLRQVKKAIVAATLEIHTRERGKGLCVLIEGGLLLTAAHCTDFDCKGRMALGYYSLHKLSSGNRNLKAVILAVEPVSDIAVLGSPDEQALPDEAAALEEFSYQVVPVRLQRTPPKTGVAFPIWIRTHKRAWVRGVGRYFGSRTFCYETRTKIDCGTSGGPILNNAGKLLGVVSHGVEKPCRGVYQAAAPLACMALPAWVLRQLDETSG